MFTTWVAPKEADNRLDAEFYRPEYVENTKIISSYKRLISFEGLRRTSKAITYGVLKPQFTDDGVPLIRNQDFAPPSISTGTVARISSIQSKEYSRSVVDYGDLLITIGGYVGTAAVVPSTMCGANINQHIARVSLKEQDADPFFYWAFVESKPGKKLLERWVSGTVQAGINLTDLKRLSIPWPKIELQRAIGNKVRKAERLRELASSALEHIETFLGKYKRISIAPSLKEQPRWFGADLLSTNSWGPEYNRAIEGHSLIPEPVGLSSFLESCRCGDPIRSDQRVKGEYRYYGASGPIDKHNNWNFEGQHLIVAQDGSIGHASVAEGRFWANNHVWILKVKPEYDAYGIAYYLNNLYPYWPGITTGSVVPKVTSENLLRIAVPLPFAMNHEHIGNKLLESTQHMEWSSKSIETAKSDVEALIDGTLDQEQLLVESEEIELWLEANPSPSTQGNEIQSPLLQPTVAP